MAPPARPEKVAPAKKANIKKGTAQAVEGDCPTGSKAKPPPRSKNPAPHAEHVGAPLSVSDRFNMVKGEIDWKVTMHNPDKKPKPLTEAQRKKLLVSARSLSEVYPSDEEAYWERIKLVVAIATRAPEELVLRKVASYRQLLKTVIAEAEA